MKKQFNARLGPDTLLAIKIAAKEWGCSEAEVIERWAYCTTSVKKAWDINAGNEPSPSVMPRLCPSMDTRVMPKGSLTKEDLKAMIAGGTVLGGSRAGKTESPQESVKLWNTPRAPFDFEENGEKYRVRQEKNGLGIYWVGEDGETRQRSLNPGELEKLWDKRTK